MGNGENAGNQHFLLFPQCFQNASFSGCKNQALNCPTTYPYDQGTGQKLNPWYQTSCVSETLIPTIMAISFKM